MWGWKWRWVLVVAQWRYDPGICELKKASSERFGSLRMESSSNGLEAVLGGRTTQSCSEQNVMTTELLSEKMGEWIRLRKALRRYLNKRIIHLPVDQLGLNGKKVTQWLLGNDKMAAGQHCRIQKMGNARDDQGEVVRKQDLLPGFNSSRHESLLPRHREP